MFKLREYQRWISATAGNSSAKQNVDLSPCQLDTLESSPMFGAHAHRDDVTRGAEEDRENAKGRKREIEADESSGLPRSEAPAW